MSDLYRKNASGIFKDLKSGVEFTGYYGGSGGSFRTSTEYRYGLGGQLNYQVQIVAQPESITKNIENFIAQIEHFYINVDPCIKVFATAIFSGEYHDWIKDSIILYVEKKHFGKRRVCYSSLGHVPKDITHPESWQILTIGILWTIHNKSAEATYLVSPIYANVVQ